MYKPQDIMIGDWLLYKGVPHRVVGIMTDSLNLKSPFKSRCDIPLFASYRDVGPIPISPDYLKLFGFEMSDGENSWLDGTVWKIVFDEKDVEDCEATEFEFSWKEDGFGDRSYITLFRGYGDNPYFNFDAISDIQHFFYQESHCQMPLSCHPQSMPVSNEAKRFLEGPKKKQLYTKK